MQKIIHKLAKVLILQYKTISIRNEASKSHYISSYLVVASNFFKNRFTICSEKAISDPNGHRLLDYPLVTSTSSKVIGAIEVKATDYLQNQTKSDTDSPYFIKSIRLEDARQVNLINFEWNPKWLEYS
ncbi:hypothetical protein C2G38_2172824 [Gigaspora rosea]|uniref:Uncharacterized protein n=1 Tax=Gigaspora rosea TaxID=44941 RepID=A0A397VLZ1_9GLOM|nr:hypothetical protein C2G38_2172824 [Gigaspora rosea]